MVLLFFVTGTIWILNQADFYKSEALQSDHAACEIWNS